MSISDNRVAELLDRIESSIQKEDVRVTALLQSAMLLGARTGASKLYTWASLELNGYPNNDDVPDYRRITAIIQVDAIVGNTWISGQTVGSHQLPQAAREAGISEEVRLGHPIGELEALCVGDEHSLKFTVPMASQIAAALDRASGQPFQRTHSLYWSTSRATIRGTVERVRTALVSFVSELAGSHSGTRSNSSSRVPPASSLNAGEQLDKTINLIVNVSSASNAAAANDSEGFAIMGDNFSGISNSTIVNRSLVANSLNRLNEQGERESAEAMRQLAEAIEGSGSKEAAECLDSMNEELAKPEPRKAVMKAMWERIIILLPYIANTATIATGIGNILT